MYLSIYLYILHCITIHLACTGGMYGSNCSVICGNCFESQQCHHINGTCMNGCSRGYQGVHCTEGLHSF